MMPVKTEKAIRLIEAENTLIFEIDRRLSKTEIKKQVEGAFGIKVDSVNTVIRKNKKYAYTKLNKKNPAIDVATKLGMI